MKISTPITTLLCATVALSFTFNAQAHRAWVKPSTTNLSGKAPWVTFDAAVSNTLFVPEHAPLRLTGLTAVGPDGKNVDVENSHTGKFRSTFDLALTQPGTYKVGYSFGGLRAMWKDENGKRKMWPGRGKTADVSEFDTAVPKNADSLKVSYSFRRIETFVTAGAPTTTALKPTNSGLELIPQTHPNDLYAGESAKFQFFFEGKPAANTKIAIVAGQQRFRNNQNQIDVVTDAQGYFSVTWPEAGVYLLEAEYEDNKAKAPATKRTGGYNATFEVLPM